MTGVQFDLLIGVLCVLVLLSLATLIIFLLEAGKFGQLFKEIEKFKIANNAELNSMVWHEKKLEGEASEIILELRRVNKMLYEIRGAGVTDFIQEYHDSDTFRRERSNKFKTNVDINQGSGDINQGSDDVKPESMVKEKRNRPSIDDLTKTPVVSSGKSSKPAPVEIETKSPMISRKDKIARRAEFMKKIAEKGGSHENLVQKMLNNDSLS